MGVLEEVGKSMPWAHVSASVLGVLPQIFFCFTCSEVDSNTIWAKKC